MTTTVFHCCVDCDHLQDRLKFECFCQMVEHKYVHNMHINLGTCSGYSFMSLKVLRIFTQVLPITNQ